MMRYRYLLIFLVLCTQVRADLSGSGGLYDAAGNGLTSQASGSQRSLDVGITVSGTHVDPRTRTWSLLNSSDSVTSHQGGTWNLTNISGTISLPTGASTSALQTTGNTSLSNIDADLDVALSTRSSEATLSALNDKVITTANGIKVDASTATQPISAAALPLPTGASTSANQSTGNTSLANIDSDLDVALSTRASESTLSTLSGKVANNFGAASGAVRTASQLGNASGAADFGAGTVSAQTLRVILPTDQTSIPAAQSGTWNINNVSGTISLPTGAATSANQSTANTSLSNIGTDASTLVTQTDGVEASLTSIDGKLNSLGQKAMSASVPVVLSSDQVLIPEATVRTTQPSAFSDAASEVPGLGPYGMKVMQSEQSILALWGKMFSASTTLVSTGSTSETVWALFRNPNASGVNCKINSISFNAPVSGDVVFRIYRSPTVTGNGTALTTVGNRNTNQSTAQCVFSTGPTVSANGTLFRLATAEFGSVIHNYDFSFWVEPNTAILITAQQGTTGSAGSVSLEWAEQP